MSRTRAATTPRAAAGFTLIEVLIAMLILAVGLLGVEALGIGAARMVNRADRMSQYLSVASTTMETTRGQVLSAAVAPVPFTRTDNLPDGARARVAVTTPAANLYNVAVTVYPPAANTMFKSSDSIRVQANVYRP